jgi:membrane-associated protein
LNFALIVDVFLHLDQYLNVLLSQYNVLAYVLLFAVIFLETGLVVTPFLPGDSLIFAAAAIAGAGGPINVPLLLVLFYIAAVAGDTVNYHIGYFLREKINGRQKVRLIKQEYLDRTNAFFDKYGGKTITIARFVPIVRTFAPFVAGVGEMSYRHFLSYNIVGGISWVSLMFGLGYFFGNIEFIKTHFSLIVIAIVIISVLPALIALFHNKTHPAQGTE